MNKSKEVVELERVLAVATEGMSMLEKALYVAGVMREGTGDEWRISFNESGGFSVDRKK